MKRFLSIRAIAAICHEANAEYCRQNGDKSQPSWDEAPGWQRDSAIAGVTAILEGRVLGPEGSHLSWLAQKEAEGWTYGPVKDPVKKEHPCCVPYEQLPIEQRAKDHIFLAIVQAAAPFADIVVELPAGASA